MERIRRNRIPLRFSAVIAAVTWLAIGCSGTEAASPTQDSPATTVTNDAAATTEPAEAIPEIAEATKPTMEIIEDALFSDPGHKILERYYQYVQAEFIATAPPEVDPDYEPLKDLVTGGRAAEVEEYLADWKEKNYVSVVADYDTITTDVRFLSTITFSEKEGSTVAFQDCLVDTSNIVVRDTGEVVTAGPRTYLRSVELTHVDGKWRVSRQEINKIYEEVSTCPDRP